MEIYANFIIKQEFHYECNKNPEIIGYQKRRMGALQQLECQK